MKKFVKINENGRRVNLSHITSFRFFNDKYDPDKKHIKDGYVAEITMVNGKEYKLYKELTLFVIRYLDENLYDAI